MVLHPVTNPLIIKYRSQINDNGNKLLAIIYYCTAVLFNNARVLYFHFEMQVDEFINSVLAIKSETINDRRTGEADMKVISCLPGSMQACLCRVELEGKRRE